MARLKNKNKGYVMINFKKLIVLSLLLGVTLINADYVKGYTKSNGTYVKGYYRSSPNYTKSDNYTTKGNINPYTGKKGTIENEYPYNYSRMSRKRKKNY